MADEPLTTPIDVLNTDDPGDDTQRRFRYQHAYGVILLAGTIAGKLSYRALWCEHHEDLLAERDDGLFDSFLLKTRQPERGHWECKDEALVLSVGRCVELDGLYPGKFAVFNFVSNALHLDNDHPKQIKKSPVLLKRAVLAAGNLTALPEPFLTVLREMAATLGADAEKVFSVWKRLELVPGPGLDDFDAVVAHDHLGAIPSCASHSPARLNALRDELIQKVYSASSIAIQDGAKHWIGVTAPDGLQPRLHAKRITIDDARRVLFGARAVPFRFAPAPTAVQIGAASENSDVLEKKLLKGGLGAHVEVMRRRTISTEQHLLEMSYQRPDEIEAIMNQLDGVVHGEATDAQLEASAKGSMYGEEMLRLLSVRLRTRAHENPGTIFGQEYECLMGFAGSLTNECKVWWSPPFDVGQPL